MQPNFTLQLSFLGFFLSTPTCPKLKKNLKRTVGCIVSPAKASKVILPGSGCVYTLGSSNHGLELTFRERFIGKKEEKTDKCQFQVGRCKPKVKKREKCWFLLKEKKEKCQFLLYVGRCKGKTDICQFFFL